MLVLGKFIDTNNQLPAPMTEIPRNIHRIILETKISARNDDEFIQTIDELVNTNGQTTLVHTFNLLAGLYIPAATCKDLWSKVKQHRQTIIEKLGREVDLTTSLSDYFHNCTKMMCHPRLVEATEFENILYHSNHDRLTKLYNRRYFEDIYNRQIMLSNRYREEFSVLFFDLDNFGIVNNSHGHLAGDAVLEKIGAIFLEEKRDSDIAARYGGEEFVLLLPHTDYENAYTIANRLRKYVAENCFTYSNIDISITMSGGVASYPSNCPDPGLLLQMADNAMYKAKDEGKNRISHYRE